MGKGAGDALGTIGTVAGVASPLLGAGFGIANMIAGAKEQRDAEEALNNYKRQQLTNVAEGLQVSTLGSDLQRQEQARLASGEIQALQGGGARTLLGGLGRVEAGNQKVMAETGANLDQQQKAIDQMYAEDQARIRSMQENREQNDINALSSQYQSGKNDRNMGIGNVIQGVGMIGGTLGQYANNNSPYSASASAEPLNLVNPDYQSPASNQFAKDMPNNFNFPTYQQPPAYGPQNAYGVFNRYPYQQFGPQNQ